MRKLTNAALFGGSQWQFLVIISGFLFINGCITSKPKAPNGEQLLIDANTFLLSGTAVETAYAYTEQNPVKVGGFEENKERLNQRRYLNALLGPNGEEITYQHVKSCCYKKIKLPDGREQLAFLDQFELQIGTSNRKLVIFISTFEQDQLLAPRGLTYK